MVSTHYNSGFLVGFPAGGIYMYISELCETWVNGVRKDMVVVILEELEIGQDLSMLSAIESFRQTDVLELGKPDCAVTLLVSLLAARVFETNR